MKREKGEDKSVEGGGKRMRGGRDSKKNKTRQTDRWKRKIGRKKEEGKQWQTRERT